MSFVVAYLIRAREFVVVPDAWIKDLNTAKLKNYGKNSNQDFLLFWSANNRKPNATQKANFDATIMSEYRATIDEACYLARIKKFFGKQLYSFQSRY